MEHRGELEEELEAVFASRTAREWQNLLDGLDVPCEISVDTNDGETVLFDEDNVRQGLVTEYEHPILGRMRQFGHLINFSKTPGNIQGPPPLVGEHTDEIMQWLGYDADTVAGLKAEGVIYASDENYPWAW